MFSLGVTITANIISKIIDYIAMHIEGDFRVKMLVLILLVTGIFLMVTGAWCMYKPLSKIK